MGWTPMSDKRWPGKHTLPCGETFPLNDPVDSLVIQIHQEFCVVDQAAYLTFMETLKDSE